MGSAAKHGQVELKEHALHVADPEHAKGLEI
jgi:hypothetical protein